MVDFHVTWKPQVSSLLKPNLEFLQDFPESERFEVLETVKLEVDSLDSQLREHQVLDADFLKIDVQGCALPVLEGSQSILRNSIFGLEVETEFAGIYVGQPHFSEVDQFLTACGFDLFDFAQHTGKEVSDRTAVDPKGK